MRESRYTQPFVAPDSVAECDDRMTELKSNLLLIAADLQDPTRRQEMGARDYEAWRVRARRAQAHLKYELGMLKTWRQKWQAERAAINRAAKEQRIRDDAAREQERRERFDRVEIEHGLEADLILRLFLALTRRYRKDELTADEPTSIVLSRARQYLEDLGVFE